MTPTAPIPDERLMAFVLGDLPPAEAVEIARTAAASPALAAIIERFRAVARQMNDAGPLAATFHVAPDRLAALRQIGGALRPAAQDAPAPSAGSVVRALASLVFDSWARPTAPGFRAGALEADRLLRFEFPGGSVDLRVARDPTTIGRFWLIGEARGDGLLRVRFARGPAPEAPPPIELHEDGFFELAVSSGDHTLEIETRTGLFAIGPLNVGPR